MYWEIIDILFYAIIGSKFITVSILRLYDILSDINNSSRGIVVVMVAALSYIV